MSALPTSPYYLVKRGELGEAVVHWCKLQPGDIIIKREEISSRRPQEPKSEDSCDRKNFSDNFTENQWKDYFG